MPIDTRAALLQVVLDNPADDAPRLILADWLEERGEEARAEFIRVQVELASLIGCLAHEASSSEDIKQYVDRLRRRERELLSDPESVWIGDSFRRRHYSLPNSASYWIGTSFFSATFRRGFVAALTLTAADFLTHADALTASQPIEVVKFTAFTDADDYLLIQIWHDEKPDELLFKTPLDMLHHLWPRIAFTLPPAELIEQDPVTGELFDGYE